MEFMERSEALRLGLSKYRTGRPCANGHEGERYTQSGNCCVCLVENMRKVAQEAGIYRRDFEAQTTEIFLFVYDEDLKDLEIFIQTRCAAKMASALYREKLKPVQYVGKGVQQMKIRVPTELRAEILKLGESFVARHSLFKPAA